MAHITQHWITVHLHFGLMGQWHMRDKAVALSIWGALGRSLSKSIRAAAHALHWGLTVADRCPPRTPFRLHARLVYAYASRYASRVRVSRTRLAYASRHITHSQLPGGDARAVLYHGEGGGAQLAPQRGMRLEEQ